MNTQATGDGTVGKALDVLDIVVGFGRAVRFSEVLEVSPYPKATLHRMLGTLTNQGMLAYDDDRGVYVAGMRLVRIGRHAWNQSSLAVLGRPFAEALAEDIKETVHLAQMERGRVVFIDKVTPEGGFPTMARSGRRSPAHCTGVGKVMLAFMDDDRRAAAIEGQTWEAFTPKTHQGPETLLPELEEIRDVGLAYDREEHEQGIISMAAPIKGGGGRVIGSISIVTSVNRMSLDEIGKYRPALTRTAAQIGREGAVWPYPVVS
ncbi:IclR family transcriptional regulator [Pacificoceanicola onchidii]|uniref:IclR family transcriptional regulator n=1 Tax=Pacificoceanicola onchidii TaxID=2562685 RepID=UPI0010A62E1F|nr:IclR family transcriptional regulator [Pacificoceanicola onchidii]